MGFWQPPRPPSARTLYSLPVLWDGVLDDRMKARACSSVSQIVRRDSWLIGHPVARRRSRDLARDG